MRICLLVVGKTTDPHFAAGIEEYARRIRHYLPFDLEVIPELRNTKNLSEEQQKEKVLQAMEPYMALDQYGRTVFWNITIPCIRQSFFPAKERRFIQKTDRISV